MEIVRAVAWQKNVVDDTRVPVWDKEADTLDAKTPCTDDSFIFTLLSSLTYLSTQEIIITTTYLVLQHHPPDDNVALCTNIIKSPNLPLSHLPPPTSNSAHPTSIITMPRSILSYLLNQYRVTRGYGPVLNIQNLTTLDLSCELDDKIFRLYTSSTKTKAYQHHKTLDTSKSTSTTEYHTSHIRTRIRINEFLSKQITTYQHSLYTSCVTKLQQKAKHLE